MLQKFREKLHKTQRGAIMVFFAILVPFFLGMIGFAVDAGFLYMQKAKLQDVADAAALAGAGHLKDGDDGSKRRLAVSALAEANGYVGEATGGNYVYDDYYTSDDAVNPTKYAPWKLAQKVLPKVMDKDGVQRDHVRVLMVKNVPTFFIRMLFPDQKEVVVKAAAEAEYVEGQQVVTADVPRIICAQISALYSDANSIIVNKGQDFSFAARSSGSIDYSKLPSNSTGTVFSKNVNHNTPEGWDYVNIQKKEYEWENPYYSSEEEKKIADETNKNCDTFVSKTRSTAYSKASEVELYKNGVNNKRYIGIGADGQIVNNIKENDTEIDLYIKGTDIKSYGGYDKNWSLIFDKELKNVKKINTIIADATTNWYGDVYGGTLTIDTKGITYGDIYTLDNVSLYISGEDNYFKGLLYCGGGELYVGGKNNHYITDLQGSKGAALIVDKGVLSLGRTKKPTWGEDKDINDQSKVFETIKGYYEVTENSSGWHMYWGDGSGSSSSGGSSSDSSGSTNAHVRLVK